jgi:hypothetical protein
VFLDAGPHRPGREFPGQRDEILVGVGRACGDVDQCGDFRIGADFADDRSAPRVRDQHRRAIPLGQGAAGSLDRILQRGQRILHGGHREARRLQFWNDFGPARPSAQAPCTSTTFFTLGDADCARATADEAASKPAASVKFTSLRITQQKTPRFRRGVFAVK